MRLGKDIPSQYQDSGALPDCPRNIPTFKPETISIPSLQEIAELFKGDLR